MLLFSPIKGHRKESPFANPGVSCNGSGTAVFVDGLRPVRSAFAETQVGQGLLRALAERLLFLWRIDVGQPDSQGCAVHQQRERVAVLYADDFCRKKRTGPQEQGHRR